MYAHVYETQTLFDNKCKCNYMYKLSLNGKRSHKYATNIYILNCKS